MNEWATVYAAYIVRTRARVEACTPLPGARISARETYEYDFASERVCVT